MKRLEMVRNLLHRAAQDQAVLEALLPNPEFDIETIGFHAQQAVEKLLKAWLAYLGVDYPKVHRLETLVDLLEANGKTLPEHLVGLGRLTPFATAFRYDDLPLSPDIQREGLLDIVRKVRAFIEKQIGNL
jgi:HEPN domain-containing protein